MLRISVFRPPAQPQARAAPTESDMQHITRSILSRSILLSTFSSGLALAALTGACSSDDESAVTGAATSASGGGATSNTTNGQGGGGGGGGAGGGGGGGAGGGEALLPCLDASAYDDAFELAESSLCVVARFEAPFIVGFDESFAEVAPTWGRHGGPLTLAQKGTTFTLSRWKVPAGAGGELTLEGSPTPIESAIEPAIAPAQLFLNAAAVDLPFGGFTLVGWSEFGTPNGEALLVGAQGIEKRFGVSGLYASVGIYGQAKARLLSTSLSAVGKQGNEVGLYANDFCGAGATFAPCILDSGSVKKGLITKQGDASGPVAIDRDGNALTVFPTLSTNKQTLVGYASDTVAPTQASPIANELATLDGSGTSLAALAPLSNVIEEDGLAFFQPAQMFVPGDVVVQRYVVDAGGKKLAAKGTPTLALVPKAPGADVRLMVDGAGRLWASLRVDPKAPGSAFFVIDRKALH